MESVNGNGISFERCTENILDAKKNIEHARVICNDSQVSFYLTKAIEKLKIVLEEDRHARD